MKHCAPMQFLPFHFILLALKMHFVCNRLARCVHMAEIFTSLEHVIEMLTKNELSNAVRRLIRLFVIVILLVHTFACVWLFIAEFTRFNVPQNKEIYQDWLSRDLSNPSTNISPGSFILTQE